MIKKPSVLAIMVLIAASMGCQYFQGSSGKSSSGSSSESTDGDQGGPKGQVAVQLIKGESVSPARVVDIRGRESVLQVTRSVVPVSVSFQPNGQARVDSVDGIRNDPAAGHVWGYEVNGITQTSGPNAVYVGNGDVVRWRLQ